MKKNDQVANNAHPPQGQPQPGMYGGQYQGPPQGGAHPQGNYPVGGYPQQQWAPAPPPHKKNWFLRHKILSALLALVLIGCIASAASGGGSKDGDAASSRSGASTQNGSEKGKEDKLPAVGQPVTDGKFQFTITKVERDVPSIGDQYMSKKAQGSYTLVHVTVKNVGTEAETMMADGQKAYDADGVGYEATSDGAVYISGNDTLFAEINPGNTLKGILVFDAPKGKKLTKVRLHESMFSNGSEGSL